MLTYFLAYLICGCVIGFCAGLLGIGGGIIGIPLLFMLFTLQGVSDSISMHMAVGTLFATVIMTSIASLLSHFRSGMVLFPVFKKIIWGTMMGCILGIIIANHLNGLYLQRLFGVFLLGLALQYFFKKEIKAKDAMPKIRNIFIATTLIGLLSGLLGLGGGIFIVPYLNWYGISMRNAIATSSACILPVAVIGAVGYMYSGMNVTSSIEYSSGFVDWPAFLGISLTSILFAPIGARVTHSISPVLLKNIFSVFLTFIGVSMLIQSV
jgi:uncharacterized membrane protein YfcA